MLSPLLWGRGLKCSWGQGATPLQGVAPFVGAWIEIEIVEECQIGREVAPFVGAWIEINLNCNVEYNIIGRPFCGGVD